MAVSPDGRDVYATTHGSASVITFIRNRKTGALRQLPPSASGCISGRATPGCTAGRGIKWPDVVVVSKDGKNVYVGDFAGSGVTSFSRAGKAGALTQLPGTAGCITEAGEEGCAKGTEMDHVEGMAINEAGTAVYAAAAFSSAIDVLHRERSTGALTQATDGSGCITAAVVAGCTQGYEIGGVNALVVAPERPQRLRDLADQQQRHDVPHDRGRRPQAAGPAEGRKHPGRGRQPGRLPRLPAGARLLVRPRDQGARGARPLARPATTSTSPPLKPERSTCSIAA